MNRSNPYFFYLTPYYLKREFPGNNLHGIWKNIKQDLIFCFGEPSDPSKALTARWCPSLTSISDRGKVPRGIYIGSDEDAVFFSLRYPEATLRSSDKLDLSYF